MFSLSILSSKKHRTHCPLHQQTETGFHSMRENVSIKRLQYGRLPTRTPKASTLAKCMCLDRRERNKSNQERRKKKSRRINDVSEMEPEMNILSSSEKGNWRIVMAANMAILSGIFPMNECRFNLRFANEYSVSSQQTTASTKKQFEQRRAKK